MPIIMSAKGHENISEREEKYLTTLLHVLLKNMLLLCILTGVSERMHGFLTTTPAHENSSTTERSLNTHKDDICKLALQPFASDTFK